METKEFKTKSQFMEEEFHNYLENKLKMDGYSQAESELYFKFEEYINRRLGAIETTMSMIANGIAIQKDTGEAMLREVPQSDRFTIKLETMDQTVNRESYLDYVKKKSMEAITSGIPTLDREYDYLFKQVPSLNRVMKSSGVYPVSLVAMMLQRNQKTNSNDLVCLFETYTGDVFSYLFRKNQKHDMFTPNYNSTFEIKSKDNVGRSFNLRVAASRTSGLLRIIDMVPMETESVDQTSHMETMMGV